MNLLQTQESDSLSCIYNQLKINDTCLILYSYFSLLQTKIYLFTHFPGGSAFCRSWFE